MAFQENSFRYRFRGPIRVGLTLVVIIFGLGLFYGLSLLGPRKVDPVDVIQHEPDAAVLERLTQSEKYEQEYLAIQGLREPNEKDLALLQRAIVLQQEYIQGIGGFDRESNERLLTLEGLFQEQAAKQLWTESVEQEQLARTFADGESAHEALPHLERALALQQQIDVEFPQSSSRNVIRAIRLEREVTQLQALPLYETTQREEQLALQAIEAQQWDSARSHYTAAIAAQRVLNMEYRGLQYADLNRLKALEVELDSLQSSNLYEAISTLVEQGNEQFAAKAYREAADSFQQAARLQAELNDEFANSRFASSAELEKWETLNQTSLSQELGDEILSQVQQLDKHLLGRNHWQAVEIINGLYQQAERFVERYPRSTILGEELVLKLQYLSFIQEDIGFFQERIYGQLLPLPKTENVHMATTEVTQAFYASIMFTNPSRNQGDLLPVNSVNYAEAQEFCQKVSWILAREVRLPNEVEFREGVGSLRYVKLDEVAWFAENSDGLIQPVKRKEMNAQGFYDLLGNVAEWLEKGGDLEEGEALVAGGSASDSIDVLADIPVEPRNAASRNRLTGFRYVVLFNDVGD